jgi:hypothetical protein
MKEEGERGVGVGWGGGGRGREERRNGKGRAGKAREGEEVVKRGGKKMKEVEERGRQKK